MVDDTGHYIADNGAVLAPKFGLDADTINHVLASQDYLKRLYNAREKMEQQNQRLFHEQEPARRQRKAEEDAKKPPSYLKQFLYGEYDEIPTNIFVKGMLEDVSAVATDYDYRHISFAEYKAQIKSIVQQVKDQNALQEFRSQMEDSFVNNVGWTKTDMSVLRNAVRKAGGITQH